MSAKKADYVKIKKWARRFLNRYGRPIGLRGNEPDYGGYDASVTIDELALAVHRLMIARKQK